MNAEGDLTHRDEIHGDVDYDPLAVALLDTDAMQRLGRVYQLGYGHLVYRGGTHTRLSHCMGAYATALRMVAALERSYQRRRRQPKGAIAVGEFLPRRPEDKDDPKLALDLGSGSGGTNELADRWIVLRSLVGWAALVHDLGHVPLGHTLEDEFEGLYEKHDSFTSPRLRHLWLAGLDGGRSEIADVLGRRELYPEAFGNLGITNGDDVWGVVFLICTWKEKIRDAERTPFAELLRLEIKEAGEGSVAGALLAALERLEGTLFSPYMADIVANTISADYLDYLRRDPHNLGLDVLRDDRVVSRFVVGRDHLGQARMALSLVDRRGKHRLDTCTGVVELVRQRFRFAEIVYYHKTKVSASAMLAKVLSYVGPPQETPVSRDLPAPEEVEREVHRLARLEGSERRDRLSALKSAVLPSALLDPEVGDETLHLWLRHQAWAALESAVESTDQESAIRALRAISLLDSIAKRRLHKVAFAMDSDAFGELSETVEASERERALQELIKSLRNDVSRRERLEEAMLEGAGAWPDSTLLLYVPPRKSQAKGIETGALSNKGVVIPLGVHQAVKEQVTELNQRYKGLWRLLVLVHPDRARDAIGLSGAIDRLAAELFPRVSLEEHRVIGALAKCCWFTYLPRRDRAAARRYNELLDGAVHDEDDWDVLWDFDGVLDGSTTEEERSLGAALLERATLRLGNRDRAKALVGEHFSKPGSLVEAVADARQRIGPSASRLGGDDVDAETRATITALEELTGKVCEGR